jgi:double-stranded uracil-DNA glycosylase
MPRGFPPLATPGARLLVLGSLPGRRSLEAGEYYAQPQNSFWRIMGELFDAPPTLPYAERVARLTASGVAVWDVLAQAERAGSLDAAIVRSSAITNPLGEFLAAQPHIGMIAFNGATAAALYARQVLPGLAEAIAAIPRVTLPSTSPAHAALGFAEKLARWSILRQALQGRRAVEPARG